MFNFDLEFTIAIIFSRMIFIRDLNQILWVVYKYVFCWGLIIAASSGATSLPGVEADRAAKTEGESPKARADQLRFLCEENLQKMSNGLCFDFFTAPILSVPKTSLAMTNLSHWNGSVVAAEPKYQKLRGVFLVDSVVESEPGPSTSTTEAAAAPSLDGANIQLPTVADELASLVAVNGDQVEIMAREKNMDEPELS